MPPVVAFGAGKGGVGTTTIAARFAALAAGERVRVLSIDLASPFGAMASYLGVKPRAPFGSLRAGTAVRDLVLGMGPSWHFLDASRAPEGLSVGEHHGLLRRLVDIYPSYDLVVIDAGCASESIRAAVRAHATRVVAVTAYDRIALAATYAVIKLLTEVSPATRVDVLPNRVTPDMANLVHEHLTGAAVRFLSRTVPLAGSIAEGDTVLTPLPLDSESLASATLRDLREQVLAPEGARGLLRLLKNA